MCAGCLEPDPPQPQSGSVIHKGVFLLVTASLGFCSEPCTSRACWFDHGVRARLAGNYADAEAAFLKALAITDEARPTAATIQHSLGLLYTEVGRYQDAEFTLRQALGDESDATRCAATEKQLGDVLLTLGRSVEAEQFMRKALTAFESGAHGSQSDVALCWNSLGMIHYATGELSKADNEYRRALAILQDSCPPDYRALTGVLVNLGQLARFERRYGEAESWLSRALTLQEQTFGPRHPRIAITLNHLGRTYADEQAYATAEPLYARALDIATAPHMPELPIVPFIRSNLAEAYRKRRAFPEAELEYRKALAEATAIFGAVDPNVCEILADYAALLRQLKRKREARDIEIRVAAIRRSAPKQSVDIRMLRIGAAQR